MTKVASQVLGNDPSHHDVKENGLQDAQYSWSRRRWKIQRDEAMNALGGVSKGKTFLSKALQSQDFLRTTKSLC